MQPGGDSLLHVHIYYNRLPAICCFSDPEKHKSLGVKSGLLESGPQYYSHSAVTRHKLAGNIGPLIGICLDVLGSIWLAAICNRCQHEASCHHLLTDIWHIFLLCQDTSPWATMEKRSNISADYTQIWCVPSAKHMPCSNWSQNKVLDITVFVTLLSQTASHKWPNKPPHNKYPQWTLQNRPLWQSLGRKKRNIVTLFTCVSWEMNNVTAKQDVSALETFNKSNVTELIKWNNFL